jgi:hypothetical protein
VRLPSVTRADRREASGARGGAVRVCLRWVRRVHGRALPRIANEAMDTVDRDAEWPVELAWAAARLAEGQSHRAFTAREGEDAMVVPV